MPPHNAVNSLFLSGEIHALLTFAQVIATTCPNRQQVLSDFGAAEQVGLANLEMQPTTEKLIDGYLYAMGQIRRALETATGTN